jgi:hypothetical protein
LGERGNESGKHFEEEISVISSERVRDRLESKESHGDRVGVKVERDRETP